MKLPNHPPSRFSILLTGALALLSAGHAPADAGRSSTSYALTHESNTGTLGGRSSSADYTLDYIGDVAGGESSSTDYRHRDGFAGQLLDPAELVIRGGGNVLEDRTRDLDADLIHDDGTMEIDVPALWGVESGPLLSVDSDGIVTPEPVYRNVEAFVRADYHGAEDTHRLVVINILKDNYGIYANDGLPDTWQWQNFGLDNPDAAPGLDPDGDGQNNRLEYLAGYVPDDSNSRLAFLLNSPDTIELSKVIPNRTYTLFRSTDLVTWTDTGASLSPAAEQADETLTDPNPPGGDQLFYTVEIED